jgi:hypothetical protein
VNVWLPILAGIEQRWALLMAALNWVWLNVLKPCWDAIIAGLTWLYNNVWLPILAGIEQRWALLMAGINWV